MRATELAVNETKSSKTSTSLTKTSRLKFTGMIFLATAVAIGLWQRNSIVTYCLQWKATNQASHIRIADALQTAFRANQHSPHNPKTLLLLCRLQRQSGLVRESRQTIEELRDAGVPESRIQDERRLTAARSGDLESSEPFLPELLTNDDVDPQDVCEAFVVGYRTRFRIDESRALAEIWKQDFPNDFRPYAHCAMIAQMAADWSLAVDEFQKAVDRGDRRVETLIPQGLCYIELNEPQLALASFQLCTELYPLNAQGWLKQADAQFRLGNIGEAKKNYSTCLTLDPHCFEASLSQAKLLLLDGHAIEATTLLKSLVNLWPEDAATLYQYSQGLTALGKSTEAAEVAARWKEADQQVELMEQLLNKLQTEPQNTELRCQAGIMMMKHYSRSMATQYLEAVLLEDPGNSAAHEWLAEYYEKRGQANIPERHQ